MSFSYHAMMIFFKQTLTISIIVSMLYLNSGCTKSSSDSNLADTVKTESVRLVQTDGHLVANNLAQASECNYTISPSSAGPDDRSIAQPTVSFSVSNWPDSVTWSSSDPKCATISAEPGKERFGNAYLLNVNGSAPCTTTITAQIGDCVSTATLIVKPTPQRPAGCDLAINPNRDPDPSPITKKLTLNVTGSDIENVQWNSYNTACATISPQLGNQVTVAGQNPSDRCQAVITARNPKYDWCIASLMVTFDPSAAPTPPTPPNCDLQITPTKNSTYSGGSVNFNLIGTNANNASWTVANQSCATVSASGNLATITAQTLTKKCTTKITARTSQQCSASATLTVKPGQLIPPIPPTPTCDLQITPSQNSTYSGGSVNFNLTGTNIENLSWSIDQCATIIPSGNTATVTAQKTTQQCIAKITASTSANCSAKATLTVNPGLIPPIPAPSCNLKITSSQNSIYSGGNANFNLTGTNAANASWAIDNQLCASIQSLGNKATVTAQTITKQCNAIITASTLSPQCSASAKLTVNPGQLIPPIPTPPTPPVSKCTGKNSAYCCELPNKNDCLVQVVNNCGYPVYLWSHMSPQIGWTTVPENSSVFLWPKDIWGPKLAIDVSAGQPMINGKPAPLPATCDQASILGDCEIGWNFQGTLFEVAYGDDKKFSYDISAVNGFSFPMTVVPQTPDNQPTGTGCGVLHTGKLNVSSSDPQNACPQYINLYGTNVVNNMKSGVRAATYFEDFENQFSGGIDCYPPASNDPTKIQGCRSTTVFGVNYVGLFYPYDSRTPNTTGYNATQINKCPRGDDANYIIPASDLSAWTCANNRGTNNSFCLKGHTPNSIDTGWYKFIKDGINGGTSFSNIYAFPADDTYQQVSGQSPLLKACAPSTQKQDKAQLTLYIGPSNFAGGASGQCPPLHK